MFRHRADVAAAAVLIAVVVISYGATLRPGHDWGGDFSQYISHARNLSLGRPYAETRYVLTHESAAYMPASYPPIFPMLLAPVYHRFGLDFVAMKVLVQGLFVLATLTCFVLARLRGLDVIPAAVAAGAFALSGIVLSLKDLILSESTYLFFSGLTFCALAVIERRGWSDTRPMMAAAIVAMLMLLAYGTRAIGAALVIAFVVHEALTIRRIRRFNIAVPIAFVAGVAAMSATLYDIRTYDTQFPINVSAYLHNAIYYARSPASLWAGAPALVRHVLFPITALLAASAFARRMVRQPTIVEPYVGAVVVITVVYLGLTTRFLLPVLALYFVYVLEAVAWFRSRLPASPWLLRAACVTLVGASAFNLAGMEKGPFAQGPEQPTFLTTCEFIRRNVERDALIISWNPRVLALYTDRRSAWYPKTDDTGFDRYVARLGAEYVLVYLDGEEDAKWLLPHVTARPARFATVFKNPDFVMYQHRHQAADR